MIQQTVARIRSEFLEMPGMRLTAPQVQRLCGLDSAACDAVLGALVDAGFLRYNDDGTYTRPHIDSMSSRLGSMTPMPSTAFVSRKRRA